MSVANMKIRFRELVVVVATCLILASTLASASANAEEDVAEASLKERVEQRWAALIKRDFYGAYRYETPAFREVYSGPQYLSQFGSAISWRQAEVTKQDVKDDVAKVTVLLHYEMITPDLSRFKSRRYLTENWVKKNGTWFHVTK